MKAGNEARRDRNRGSNPEAEVRQMETEAWKVEMREKTKCIRNVKPVCRTVIMSCRLQHLRRGTHFAKIALNALQILEMLLTRVSVRTSRRKLRDRTETE